MRHSRVARALSRTLANTRTVIGAGRVGRRGGSGELNFPPNHYRDWLQGGNRTTKCPELLKGVIPETLRFTPVANINNEFNRRFTSIKSTSDSPIKTEEQLRLVRSEQACAPPRGGPGVAPSLVSEAGPSVPLTPPA